MLIMLLKNSTNDFLSKCSNNRVYTHNTDGYLLPQVKCLLTFHGIIVFCCFLPATICQEGHKGIGHRIVVGVLQIEKAQVDLVPCKIKC